VREVSDWLGPDLINLEPPSLDRKSQFMASAVLLSYAIGEPLAEADWPGAPSARRAHWHENAKMTHGLH
jgi:hypothetical protein